MLKIATNWPCSSVDNVGGVVPEVIDAAKLAAEPLIEYDDCNFPYWLFTPIEISTLVLKVAVLVVPLYAVMVAVSLFVAIYLITDRLFCWAVS